MAQITRVKTLGFQLITSDLNHPYERCTTTDHIKINPNKQSLNRNSREITWVMYFYLYNFKEDRINQCHFT